MRWQLSTFLRRTGLLMSISDIAIHLPRWDRCTIDTCRPAKRTEGLNVVWKRAKSCSWSFAHCAPSETAKGRQFSGMPRVANRMLLVPESPCRPCFGAVEETRNRLGWACLGLECWMFWSRPELLHPALVPGTGKAVGILFLTLRSDAHSQLRSPMPGPCSSLSFPTPTFQPYRWIQNSIWDPMDILVSVVSRATARLRKFR